MSVIAGNWKMNHGPIDTRAFFRELDLEGVALHHELILFPPAVSLWVAHVCPERQARVSLGAQNVHSEPAGAVTGELSASMAVEAGACFALVGHSERRSLFGESDREVKLKVQAVIATGITPIVCVGETLEERLAGEAVPVVRRQLGHILGTLVRSGKRFLVAYEPVWAIGTGRTASSEDAHEAHSHIRTQLAGKLGAADAENVSILYGGSVKPSNAGALLATPEVDGVLVGGGSLCPADFAAIARAGHSTDA